MEKSTPHTLTKKRNNFFVRKNIQMQTPTQISCSQIAQNCTFSVYVFSLSLVLFLFEEQLNSNEIWWSENIDLPIRTYWCSFQIKHVAKSTHLQLHINRNKKLCSIRIWNVLHIRKLIHTRTGKQNELVWLKKRYMWMFLCAFDAKSGKIIQHSSLFVFMSHFSFEVVWIISSKSLFTVFFCIVLCVGVLGVLPFSKQTHFKWKTIEICSFVR